MLNDESNLCAKLKKVEFLKVSDEYALIDAIHKNMDKKSIDRIVISYSCLVFKIARYFKESSIPLNDLIQEGYVGIMKAISKFDKGLGYRFSTYAQWWIKSEINSYINKNNSIVVLPYKIKQSKKKNLDGYENGFFSFNHKDLSLNNNINDQSDLTFQDCIVDEGIDIESSIIEDQERQILKKLLEQTLLKINKTEASVIKNLFLLDFPKTYEQLQKEMHLSKQKIKNIEGRALRKMRYIFLKSSLNYRKKLSFIEFMR